MREFVAALHEVYDAAGQPAARVIARRTVSLHKAFESVSHETVSATLRGDTVPAWEKIKSILHVLVAMAPVEYDMVELEQQTNELWQRARRERQESAPTYIPVQHQPNPVAPPRPVPMVDDAAPLVGVRPPAAPGFVGRAALVDAVRTALAGSHDVRLVLHGPIGAGKTQAVLQYLDRHLPTDQAVWWIPCGTAESALASLLELAAVLRIDRHLRVEHTVRLVLERLEAQRYPYLMIFDGLDDRRLLRLVPNGGHVVITTRDPAIGGDEASTGLPVPDLATTEVAELLHGHDPDAPVELIEAVVGAYGAAPLALRQVLAWWQATGAPLDLSGDLDPADRLNPLPVDGYGRSASLALLFALDRLEAASRAALLLLEALVCFAPVPVSKALLGRAAGAPVDAALGEVLRGDIALNKTILELRRQGLARLTSDGARIEVVPLARLVARRALSGGEAERARRHAHALLAAADPGWPDDKSASEDLYREIAEHVDATAMIESRARPVREAVLHQIRFRYLVGEQMAACELGENAYNAWRIGNDPDDDDQLVLRASQAWANALRANGRYEKASRLTREAMSQLRVDSHYGEDHPHTLGMAGSRAADLRIAGDYERAREFDEETLARWATQFGADDPRTIMSRHNLAISLRLAGAFEAAEAADRTVLRQHREMFGEENWRTLLSVNALAEDLNGQGRFADVLRDLEPLRDRITARRWTWRDRGLMLAGRALALALRGAGRREEALELLRSTSTHCAELLGERHDHTLALRMSLANTLHMLGRAAEAADEAGRVLDLYRRQFGERNPLTVAAEINLANMRRAAGDVAGAMKVDGTSNEALRDKVGPHHPFLVAVAVNHASDVARSGNPNRLDMSRRALEFATRVHNHRDHPDLLAAEANLVVDLAAMNSPAAVSKRQQVLQRLERLYGADHPTAISVARGDRVDCVLEPPLP
ncbi:FxSxx-COOH system tetratricopeptide repeat protein [Dactylosporangium sp. NPDC051541]|uniref:FxSxx-COOH system tetratricopeptide repeat protein n=1 Tax=Dactylosporangium sp. NPDC051541 TaxID=3363977 RepID=UPI0037AA6AF2